MNSLIVVPFIATFLFCLAKLLENKFIAEKNDKFVLKIIVRDAVVLFGVTLIANFVYSNLHTHLDRLLNVITDTQSFPTQGLTEIFTDLLNF